MMRNSAVEVLAPAGGREALSAAVRCGADAVYLGAGSFNARRNAANFSGEGLQEAVAYCHLRGVRVYLTLNTLVSDDETGDLLQLMEDAAEAGVDAFIVQDLAVARLARAVVPDIRLHGSTQLSVMAPEGFEKLQELGFVRAVVPRELTLSEMERIHRHTDMELEAFVHGALCMSVSGQCYLSAMLGGRSGNRGLCAQPCRLPFQAAGGTGHDLSLRDLDLIEHMGEMAAAGITSFKIEGRMKRPEYVAAAVTACRNELAGIQDPELTANLRAVFSRSGFTDGYLTGRRGRDMFGTRSKDDVTAAGPILQDLQKLYADDTGPTPVDFTFRAVAGEPLKLTATVAGANAGAGASAVAGANAGAGAQATAVSAEPPQPATGRPASDASVRKHLAKTGGTAFTLHNLQIDLDDGLFLPASGLNALRREALANLSAEIVGRAHRSFHPAEAEALVGLPPHRAASPRTYIRLSSMDQYTESCCSGGALIVPLASGEEAWERLKRDGVVFGVEIPRPQYRYSERTVGRLRAAKQCGTSFAFAGALDGVALAGLAGLPVLGSFTLNAYSSVTMEEYRKLGVQAIVTSLELKTSAIERLRGDIPRGIVTYGRTPLMLTRNCPIRNGTDCRHCHGTRSLTDRKGMEFPVVCGNGASEVLNSRPIYMADKLQEVKNIDFSLVYFTIESPTEIEGILKQVAEGLPPQGEFTRGLYYRGVQ